jgi:glutathione S-transferase
LAEKGIAHRTIAVDLRQSEQFSDSFRALNPQCTVPVLTTSEGLVLTDNAAIIAWAEAERPDPPLRGRSPAEKALVASWHWRAEFEGLLAVAEALRNSSPAMANRALPGAQDYAQIPALAERGLARAKAFFATVNERLAHNTYLAGEQFSLADITAVVAIDFARIVKQKPGEEHPNLLRWRALLAQRPSMAL